MEGSRGGDGWEMGLPALATVTHSRDRHSHLKTEPEGRACLIASMIKIFLQSE